MNERADSLQRVIDRIGVINRDFAAKGTYPFKSRRLGRGQMNLLFALSRCETASVAQLAQLLSVTSGAVSQTIDSLKDVGLVINGVNPADRRGRLIALTPDARAEVAQFELEYFRELAPMFGALSTADIAELDRILGAIAPREAQQ